LTRVFTQAFNDHGFDGERIGDVSISDRPDLAQYQCNGALGAAKQQKKNPREVATQIAARVEALAGEHFPSEPFTLSLAGPGFINIVFTDAALARNTNDIASDSRLGIPKLERSRTVVVDLGGPNVAKAMHVGHLRSPIIGDALVRLHRFLGDIVIGDNHLGDWGTPMGMVICELKSEKPELPYFRDEALAEYPKESPVTMEDLERLYPQASAHYKSDEGFAKEVLKATDELQKGRPGYKALWRHFVEVTVREIERDFGTLGIHFDTWLGESFYEDKMPVMVERLTQQGHAVLSDGALTIPLATEKDPETPPLILVKSGGGFLYHTSDLATVEYRANHFKADLALYVVDKRQSLHFKQVFSAAQKTGIAGHCTLFHAAFGTMNGNDGKPFKTRAGGTIKLKDLLTMVHDEARKRLAEMGVDRNYSEQELADIAHKVGIATLKYSDLKNNRLADYVFDLDRFSQFEGNTGPYLLYAAVRIKSILRKAAEQGYQPGVILPAIPEGESGKSERTLMLEMAKLPDILSRAYEASEPHHLCDYGFALSQAFNFFYKECHILREEDAARRTSWLGLSKLVHDQLVLLLDLLGIQVPERM
jgi:arginyl-tRNA synthetase